jgi:hypothetical protein
MSTMVFAASLPLYVWLDVCLIFVRGHAIGLSVPQRRPCAFALARRASRA